MNGPGQIVFVFVCLATILFVVLGFELFIFRLACLLCKVPQPGFIRSMGMVAVLLIVPAIVDAAVGTGLIEAYKAGGYPLWEAGLVQFFLALPIHMVICSAIHAKMMNLRIGEGLTVWFVEKLLKLVLVMLLAGVVAAILLLGK